MSARYEAEPLTARRVSRSVRVGDVQVGGGAPISIQSMTNTLTADIAATEAQIRALADAGADIVRVSCPDEESTAALKTLTRAATVPLVADIHFHYRRAIEAACNGAACLRFNPGNISESGRVREVVRAARDNGCSIRIGVNSGSLERDLLERYGGPTAEALVASVLRHAEFLEEHDFREYKVSCKASEVTLAVRSNRLLASRTDAPIHIGITESGSARTGSLRSAVGLGVLLAEGIGDTLRVSLAGDPVEEVRVARMILRSLGLRSGGVLVVACPGCARQQFDVGRVAEALESRFGERVETLRVSVMGCVVNGPGEALGSDIGLTGGGRGTHQVYVGGERAGRVRAGGGGEDELVEELSRLVEERLGLTQGRQ